MCWNFCRRKDSQISRPISSDKPRNRNQIIKEDWGSRLNFQISYGLKMSPEDIEEGNLILEEMERQEREIWMERPTITFELNPMYTLYYIVDSYSNPTERTLI
ncbi:hypothetical protein WG66_016239 [Moniliophthora roreri]|nr:hypothetical protein WG66_016239 [Moniliophthora roreri]